MQATHQAEIQGIGATLRVCMWRRYMLEVAFPSDETRLPHQTWPSESGHRKRRFV
ncbi:MAG: hypothetical protein JWN65_2001 [Solirubrobacterales bacterium]|jgi:hypothetical protein|nr:hypothetical protein [Solirubrobacterales bacterium]